MNGPKVRGQTLADATGHFLRIEQGPSGWHVKYNTDGYLLGIFDTKQEALEARDEKEKEIRKAKGWRA